MSVKEQIIEVIRRLPEEVSVDEAIERLYLIRKIEIGIRQADAGDVMPHALFVPDESRSDRATQ